MSVNKEAYEQLIADLGSHHVTLVAVSKTKSVEEIKELYDLGQKDFGENYVQEVTEKQSQLPNDIRWHFIGHLQSNKVKQITSFIHLIQSVDSLKLLQEINKQGKKNDRVIDCLLQVHIAQEETKFGLDENELNDLLNNSISQYQNIQIVGLMGMASLTDDMEKVRSEFKYLRSIFNKHAKLQTSHFKLQTLSMGMSSDYFVAIEEGSNMVRIGSLIFGARN
ncbi:MAG TPA: YggS family pyridoxal phosphate-dependent enzyme [Chitinophagaceae bacterium]|jgi:pyridoxal phosphate enzyme (YggS family)|nr:YggS family pyridoxal phosphate-dependent enzyme [Chitinophagaceae bacterium]